MDIYKGLYKDSIMQFYFMFMLRNKCSVSIYFGNVRNIQCLLCLVFLQFMCKERGVKSFHKREQDIFFCIYSEKCVYCQWSICWYREGRTALTVIANDCNISAK